MARIRVWAIVVAFGIVFALAASTSAAAVPMNLNNYASSTSSANITNQSSVTRTSLCSPSQRRILGGGGRSSNPAFVIVSSHPTDSFDGWTVEWRTVDGSPQSATFDVSIACAFPS